MNDTAEFTDMSPISFSNCSLLNLCGKYGYCNDDSSLNEICLCKFWWKGKYCEQLSGSGKQVMIIGSLLFILMVLYHGSPLIQKLHLKRKQRVANTNKVSCDRPYHKISKIRPIQAQPLPNFFRWILIFGVILLSTTTLLVKWTFIQGIHDEIVRKFNRNETTSFETHSICDLINLRDEFNVMLFPIACILIIVFSLKTKRTSLQRNKWFGGYIGLPMPVDFFSNINRTFAAVIFAVFADELVGIANELFFSKALSADQGIIVTYIRQIFKVLVIGFRRYPILAAAYLRTPLVLILASFYTWFDFVMLLVDSGLCRNDFYPTNQSFAVDSGASIRMYLKYYGTGWTLVFFQLLTDIPRFVCLSYVSIKLPMMCIKRIYCTDGIDHRLTPEQRTILHSSLPTSVETLYMKSLFGFQYSSPPKSLWRKISQSIYSWHDDFRFSSRVICVYSAIFLLLFFFTFKVGVQVAPLLIELRYSCDQIISVMITLMNARSEGTIVTRQFPLPDFARPYIIAVTVAALAVMIQLVIMLASIRRNLFQLYRGDDCEIPRRNPAQHVLYINGNFRFAGSLIGYVILAYILQAFLILLITIGIETFIIYGSIRIIEKILKVIIPTLLFTLFKIYLNNVLGQYIFLQADGHVLTVNNRRILTLFMYFNFFLDAFLGFFAALLRVLKSVFGGILYMCRLDYSPLGRKLETFDDGFNAYCGFIQMEATHRHPILLFFVSHLIRDHIYEKQTLRWSKARHKWALAVFLLHNPTLIYRRKRFITKGSDLKAMKLALISRRYHQIREDQNLSKEPFIHVTKASELTFRKNEDQVERF